MSSLTTSLQNRGVAAWALGLILISFYILLYWSRELDENFIYSPALEKISATSAADSPDQKKFLLSSLFSPGYYPGGIHPKLKTEFHGIVAENRGKFSFTSAVENTASLLNPLSRLMRKKPADRWFLYGFLYTFFVVIMGIRFIRRWRDVRYQKIRTLSVMGFQTILAFLLPAAMTYFHAKEFYFHYFWPLKIEYFFPEIFDARSFPRALALWAIGMSFLAVPVLTYFFGKRWYCSWVCGCGALAETAGDPFRHLSDKSSNAWKLEQVTIYSVLALAVITTGLLFIHEARGVHDGFAQFAFSLKKWYGFFIMAGFAGVVGTGFYPLAGSRVWCRFGCPQAAILGILQVFFSRFRITTNGGQCMSCGNCSTYCEMGIDVRAYAMSGQDILRAACVGCGMCATVCPRGVLKLENGPRGTQLG